MRCLFALAILLLAACATIAPSGPSLDAQLARFGLDEAQARCVGGRLGEGLDRAQRGQLAGAAAGVTQGYFNRRLLTPRDLAYVASRQNDPRIGLEYSRAAAACGLGGDAIPSLRVAHRNRPAAASEPPPAAPLSGWIHVGAAPTGQAIAVDVGTVVETADYRQAWFRLIEPGETELGQGAYLLRIDCESRTINPMAQRRHGPGDAINDLVEHGPDGEGPLAVEAGTVMEVAYIALCGRRP